MNTLCTALSVFAVLCSAVFLRDYLQTGKTSPAPGVMYLIPVLSLISAVLSALTAVPLFFIGISSEKPYTPLAIILIALNALSVLLGIARANVRITYDEQKVTRAGILGRKKEYLNSDIACCVDSNGRFAVWFGREKINAKMIYCGRAEFRKYIKKVYRTAHGGAPIPALKTAKDSIFKDNIETPLEFVVVYSLVYAFILIGFLVALFAARPFTENDMTRVTAMISEVTVEGDDLLIRTDKDSVPFSVKEYADYSYNTEAMVSALRPKETVSIRYHAYNEGDEKESREVLELKTPDGRVYVDLELSAQRRKEETGPPLLCMFSFVAIWTLYVVLSVIVGRNADRLPPAVTRLFFKKSYIRAKSRKQ